MSENPNRYTKKSLHDHILDRPDSYVGSIEKEEGKIWIVTDEGNMELQTITWVPALYKIFDEILVNAADNRQRTLDVLEKANPENKKINLKYKIQV